MQLQKARASVWPRGGGAKKLRWLYKLVITIASAHCACPSDEVLLSQMLRVAAKFPPNHSKIWQISISHFAMSVLLELLLIWLVLDLLSYSCIPPLALHPFPPLKS